MKIKTYKVNPKLQFTGVFTFKPCACGCTDGYCFGFNTRKRGISIQIRRRKSEKRLWKLA